MIRAMFAGILVTAAMMYSAPSLAEQSDNTPIELALFPPLQLPGTEFGVKGIRLSVVGSNRELRGIDLGVIGNLTNVQFKGLAIAGLFNHNSGGATIVGLQLAALANINSGPSDVYGLQIAAFNSAVNVYGLQLGLINVATQLHGVQIGLVNINKTGLFHVSPIINASF